MGNSFFKDSSNDLVEDYYGDKVPCCLKSRRVLRGDRIDKSVTKLTEIETCANVNYRMARGCENYSTISIYKSIIHDKDSVGQTFVYLILKDNLLERATQFYEWIKKIIDHKLVLLLLYSGLHQCEHCTQKHDLCYLSQHKIFNWFLNICYYDKHIDIVDILPEHYHNFSNACEQVIIIMIKQYNIDISKKDAFFLKLLKLYDNISRDHLGRAQRRYKNQFVSFMKRFCGNKKCLFDIKKETELGSFFKNFSMKNTKSLVSVIIRKLNILPSEIDVYFIIRVFSDPRVVNMQ